MRFFLLSICLYFIVSVNAQSFTKYVNPFVGTGGHGHTFPGPVLPFGMVQLSPDTRVDGSWDACGGYHYSDSLIYGFSHTHLSGVGVNDYGDILVMPVTKKTELKPTAYMAGFDHRNEKAAPGFYEVVLNNGVKAELTATERCGIQRYTFPKDSTARIVIDLLHRDKLLKGNLKWIDSVTLIGFRISNAWATEQHCYFAMRFSKPVSRVQFGKNTKYINAPVYSKGENADACIIEFKNTDTKPLVIKTGIAFTDNDGALLNLKTEAPHNDFDTYRNNALNAWEKQLSKIKAESKDQTVLTNFYTALYHCFIHPSLFQDVDGRYRGRDNKIHTAHQYSHHTIFSLWDTYRTLHPLFSIIEQKRTLDFLNTFIHQYDESRRLPMWELAANETDCMIGFHSVSVIADCFAKGFGGFDTVVLYDAMRTSARYPKYGLSEFNKKGYLQTDDESESVSKSLEYAYDHWCIAQVAQRLNKPEDYKYHLGLSLAYKHLYDPASGFIRPRYNGNWLSPFDPKQINNHYTEANAWQYNFYVPHDIEGLIKLNGGEIAFEKKLDELFTTSSELNGREQADVTGLIGQYAHGNEPSHHCAYLYNYIGKPEKTAQRVHQILNEFYKPTPDGLIGNDDCGQMSAWYVMSSMGFYPVCPGSSQYVVGAPLMDKISLQLENGKQFVIEKANPSGTIPKYFELDGKPMARSAIDHAMIMRGGKMIFHYDSLKGVKTFSYGKTIFQRPSSHVNTISMLPAPVIVSSGKKIKDAQPVQIIMPGKQVVNIAYTLDGSKPTRQSALYHKPLTLDKSCKLRAFAFTKTDTSSVSDATFFKSNKTYSVQLMSVYNKQYDAGGPEALTDSIFGSEDWRKGDWHGYQNQNFECVVDLKTLKSVSYIGAHFLQDTRSWIVYPVNAKYYTSSDGKTWTLQETVEHSVKPDDYTVQVQWMDKQLAKPVAARYVKVVATNFGKLPEWHLGYGGDAFIFVDEIEIH